MEFLIHISISNSKGDVIKTGCRRNVKEVELAEEMDIAMSTAKLEARFSDDAKRGYIYPNIYVECVKTA